MIFIVRCMEFDHAQYSSDLNMLGLSRGAVGEVMTCDVHKLPTNVIAAWDDCTWPPHSMITHDHPVQSSSLEATNNLLS